MDFKFRNLNISPINSKILDKKETLEEMMQYFEGLKDRYNECGADTWDQSAINRLKDGDIFWALRALGAEITTEEEQEEELEDLEQEALAQFKTRFKEFMENF